MTADARRHDPETARSIPQRRSPRSLSPAPWKRHAVLGSLLVAELAFFWWLEARQHRGGFSLGLAAEYLQNLLVQSAPLLVVALGMTLVLTTAGIDLSVGAMTALVAAIMARCSPGDSFWYTALPLGLAAGAALGAFNGMCVALLDIPPIVATLGTMVLYRGLCFVAPGDREWATFVDVPGYAVVASWPVMLAVVSAWYAWAAGWLNRSRWLVEVRMLGGNRVAARYAGIRVDRRLIEVYALIGVLAWVAATLYTARNLATAPSALMEEKLELRVIVAVVLGGTRVQGGLHSFLGTLLAALFLALLDEGLRSIAMSGLADLPFKISHARYVLLGLLFGLGVWLNTRSTRREIG